MMKRWSVFETLKSCGLPIAARPANLLGTVLAFGVFTIGMGNTTIPAHGETIGASGLPLPRFVSLKAERVNMRVGPGRKYKVEWMYTKRGLPLEILQEYDNWRKVRDSEGAEGWINKSLLSGKRTALVQPWKAGEKNEYLPLTGKPNNESRLIAKIEPGVLATVEECSDGWCHLEIDDTVTGSVSGYVRQTQLWGVYPDETLD